MYHQIFTVDSFSNKPFAGNPAGVCILADPIDDDLQRLIARELNLSETAFLLDQGDHYGLRWFTPAVEIDLCGHATLASAHIIWQEGLRSTSETLKFQTRSGLLQAVKTGDWIEMDFPAYQAAPVSSSDDLSRAIGVPVLSTWRSTSRKLLAEVETAENVASLKLDFTAIARLAPDGLIVTAPGNPPYDFVSRFFVPSYGINEDPVTGSAHCVLVPFWSRRLKKSELFAFQASARGGELRLRLDGERVKIGGQATTVLTAQMRIG